MAGRSVLTARAESGPTVPTPKPPGPALARLSRDLGDSGVVQRFVGDYLALLGERVTVVERALSGGEPERTRVAILSLETSSAMVGADGVVAAAQALRTGVRQGHDVAALFAGLVAAVAAARRSLEEQGFSSGPAGG